jgi:T5orf172 domain
MAEDEKNNLQTLRVKIGRSNAIRRRLLALQTGSPYKLKLMGWINSDDDKKLEASLHTRCWEMHSHGEWFNLPPEIVIEILHAHGFHAFIALETRPSQIVSKSKHDYFQYITPWKWGDLDQSEFCPSCGCGCGRQYDENYGTARCVRCGAT